MRPYHRPYEHERELLALARVGYLGAYHGLNPATGWLFAVALGLQDGAETPLLQA